MRRRYTGRDTNDTQLRLQSDALSREEVLSDALCWEEVQAAGGKSKTRSWNRLRGYVSEAKYEELSQAADKWRKTGCVRSKQVVWAHLKQVSRPLRQKQ